MGGQACVLYGGAEFSRDLDLAIDAAPENLEKVRDALTSLEAERVFLPDLEAPALLRGHASHFRARAAGADGLRIDLMARMRGTAEFPALWERRSIVDAGGVAIPALALPDLVRAKKTQREKDWPMIRRLIEADMLQFGARPSQAQVRFWLEECRSPALLIDLARSHAEACEAAARSRTLLRQAIAASDEKLREGLAEEQERERVADAEYWRPLREELERWRRERPRAGEPRNT